MSNSLIQVPFHGDVIEAVAEDGSWLASLRRMCENLGVDYASQYKKLKDKKWATVVIITTVGADGKNRERALIDRRTMTMWLANINPGKVRKELREKIEAYQCEAADALDEYFNEGAAIRVVSDDTEDDIIAKGMLAAGRKIEQLKRENETARKTIEKQKPKVLFADAVATSKRSILVGELAKILKQNGMDTGQNRLFRQLREDGLLMKRGGNPNMPTQKAMNLGLFEVKETAIQHSDGHTTVNFTTKVTPKGQQYLIQKYLGCRPLDLEAGA